MPSREEILNAPHLATGSALPPLKAGVELRLFNMKYCPFCQRALLVAEAKGVSYTVVNCNLTAKPEFLLERNPEGKTPILETADGKILYESLIVADYLDEAYPQTRPLHSQDPYQKAKDRLLLEKFGGVVGLNYKVMLAIKDSLPDEVKRERLSEFVKGLQPFEDELQRRETIFFGGSSGPGMLDYMIWPWAERISAIKLKIPDVFDYEAAKSGKPNLEQWRQAMKHDPVVAKLMISPEQHMKFMEGYLAGKPDYSL